jgi:hypothetical protein
MWYAILALVGFMTTGAIHVEENNRVAVRGLNQRLQLTGWQTSWNIKGEVLPPVFPLPGGRILAIVKATQDGPRELVLWTKDGHELARNTLDLLGEVKDWYVSGAKLLLASETEFVEYDTGSLRREHKRGFTSPYTEYTIYRQSPSGLWVMNEKTISYFDINGSSPIVRPRPLTPVNLPPCPAAGPCSKGLVPENTKAAVAESGDLLIIETFSESYPFENVARSRDQVWPSTASILDTKGKIVSQKPFSSVMTKWEWFWSERSGSGGMYGSNWGLMRTRHKTDRFPASELLDSRGNDFLFVSGSWEDSDETVIRRMDRRLETLWKRSFHPMHGLVFSPPWASSTIFHDSFCQSFANISELGRNRMEETVIIREIQKEQDRSKFKRPRFAIGQSSEGDWLLIAY